MFSFRLKPIRKTIIAFFLVFSFSNALAWEGMPMPRLQVQGRYLKDPHGNIVNLHGFAQTYSPWFNERGTKWNNYNVEACLAYNKDIIDKILDAGWMMNFVRLHMDPYWSNSPGCVPDAHELPNCFNEGRFSKYLDEVFIPMAEYAISKGLYVIMRPPGVCPPVIGVEDDYNYAGYLLKVWDIVSNHPRIKTRHEIMFELANEPVNIRLADGTVGANTQPHFDVLKEIFQPVVNKIRENGFHNVLWIPGSGYQAHYKGFAVNPIEGENIGYAVHVYPGWFGSADGYEVFRQEWDKNVKPVTDFAPIVVSEMDWAPEKYNASWGKGITGTAGGEGFGANFKKIADDSGNVSWLIFTEPHLIAQFTGEPPAEGEPYTFLNDPEACPWPVFHWYREYADIYPLRPEFEYRSISDNGDGTFANPVIKGDFPAPLLVEEDNMFYLYSRNPNFSPDITILESRDLVNWVYSSKSPADFPSDKVILVDDNDIHSGSLIQTNAGEWWVMVSFNRGPFGSFPHLLPATREGDILVIDDSFKYATDIPKPDVGRHYLSESLQTNDVFRHYILGLQWGWHGTPGDSNWSLIERAGFMRLRTADVIDSIHKAHILSQRILAYPKDADNSYGIIRMEIDNMREGDVAGLSVFNDIYGFIGVQIINGERRLITFIGNELQTGPIVNESGIYLQAIASNSSGIARFYYSLDNETFTKLGTDMTLGTMPSYSFSGYRYGIFNYATAETGGYVDVDWFSTESAFMEVKFYPPGFEGYTEESLTLTDLIVGENITLLTKSSKRVGVMALYADGHIEDIGLQAKYSSYNPEIITVSNGIIRSFMDGKTSLDISYTGPLGHHMQVAVNVVSATFPLTNELFNPGIWETGTFDEATKTLHTGQWGFGGWQYDGIDISGYKYLVARLGSNNNANVDFRLFDGTSYWGSPASFSFGNNRQIVVDLAKAKKGNGEILNTRHIYIAGFWSNGNSGFIIDTVFLSNSPEFGTPVIYINGKGGTGTLNLGGFAYAEGSGPSASQSFTVSGDLLTGNIVITAPAGFEVSLEETEGFDGSLTLVPDNYQVGETIIYVRMKSGLESNSYGGNLTVSSDRAYSRRVSLSGVIDLPTGIDIPAGAYVVSTEYFRISGQRVESIKPLTGIFIVKEYMSDGTINVFTIFKPR
jgi:hypothetical protein